MNRWALILNGVVAQVVVSAGAPTLPGNWVLATAGVSLGWTYNGSTFSAPVETPAVLNTRVKAHKFWGRFPQTNEHAFRAVIASGSPGMLSGYLASILARMTSTPGYMDIGEQYIIDSVNLLAGGSIPDTVTIDGQSTQLRLTPTQAAAILVGPSGEDMYTGD